MIKLKILKFLSNNLLIICFTNTILKVVSTYIFLSYLVYNFKDIYSIIVYWENLCKKK